MANSTKPTATSLAPSPTLAPSRTSLSATDPEKAAAHLTATGGSSSSDEAVDVEVDKSAETEKAEASKASGTQTREDGYEYPQGLKLFLLLLALCLSVFLMALDNSIIATAIPKITDRFHSLDDVGWYGSAYLLTTSALQLLFGKFYSFFSIKWVFLTAVSIFEIGSLICGVAHNSVTLIIGRAIAGLGSAGIFSGALIILAHSVPLEKRPMYSGLIGSMYGIASVAGPLLGGVFTDKVTWRWCFYINLPIGGVALFVIVFFFSDPDRKHMAAPAEDDNTVSEQITDGTDGTPTVVAKKDDSWKNNWRERIWLFDPIGTVLFMPAIICLLLALQWGGTTYPWNSGRVVALFVVFGVLILVFMYVQYRQQDMATVPPRIIKGRSVMAAAWYAFCMGAAFLSSVYYLPIWFQAVKGATAVRSGLMNLPLLISMVVSSIVAGGLVTSLGYYTPLMLFGTVLTAIGYGLITLFVPLTPRPKWIGYQILAGAGLGAGIQQPLMAVQTVLDIHDVPTGTAVVVFMQTLGGALFVSICQNIFTNKLVANVHRLVPGLDPAVVLATGATSIQKVIPEDTRPGVTLAYSEALVQTFYVSTAMAALTILGSALMEWRSVKAKQVQSAA